MLMQGIVYYHVGLRRQKAGTHKEILGIFSV